MQLVRYARPNVGFVPKAKIARPHRSLLIAKPPARVLFGGKRHEISASSIFASGRRGCAAARRFKDRKSAKLSNAPRSSDHRLYPRRLGGLDRAAYGAMAFRKARSAVR